MPTAYVLILLDYNYPDYEVMSQLDNLHWRQEFLVRSAASHTFQDAQFEPYMAAASMIYNRSETLCCKGVLVRVVFPFVFPQFLFSTIYNYPTFIAFRSFVGRTVSYWRSYLWAAWLRTLILLSKWLLFTVIFKQEKRKVWTLKCY